MTDIWIADLKPRALETLTAPHDHRTYATGEEVPLRFSTAMIVAAGGVVYEPLLADFSSKKSGLGLKEGFPSVEWPKEPVSASIRFRNENGCLNWWRFLTFDGAPVLVRRLPQTSGRLGQILDAAEVHFDGTALGKPRSGRGVELDLRGSFEAALKGAAQRRVFLGLGNRLDFDGSGSQSEIPSFAQGAMTVIFLGEQSGNRGYGWFTPPPTLDEWRFVRALENGAYKFRAGALSIDSPIAPLHAAKWLAWVYDGSRADFYWADSDSSGFESLGGGAVALPPTNSKMLIGSNGSFHLGGSIASLRIYDRALTAPEIERTLGRPITLEDPQDADSLAHYYPMSEGAGTRVHDVIGDRHIELAGGVSWGATGEGGQDLRGRPMPAVLPGSAIVPLTRVATLETGNVARAHHAAASYSKVWSPAFVRLAPKWSATRTDASIGDLADFSNEHSGAIVVQEEGVFDLLFPGVVLETDYFSDPSTITVTLVPEDGRSIFFRYEGDVQGGHPPSLTLSVAAPGWDSYSDWGVKLLESHDGTFAAEVDVAGDGTVCGHVRYLLEQMGPALDPASIDDSDLGSLGAMPSSSYLARNEELTTYEALRRLLEPLGVVLEIGQVLTLRRIHLPSSTLGEIPAALVNDLEEIPVKPSPRSLKVGYAPVYVDLAEGADVPASDRSLIERARAGHSFTLPIEMTASELDSWPSALAARPRKTSLIELSDALNVRFEAWEVAKLRLLAASIREGAETFRLGDEYTLFFGSPETSWECQTGLENGERVVVVQVDLSATRAPRVTFLVAKPKILGPPP